jgi:hypothetical protein
MSFCSDFCSIKQHYHSLFTSFLLLRRKRSEPTLEGHDTGDHEDSSRLGFHPKDTIVGSHTHAQDTRLPATVLRLSLLISTETGRNKERLWLR